MQSTAVLVLAARKVVTYHAFLFANVGDDSENPETLSYLENYAKPYALQNSIALLELRREYKDGRTPTIYQNLVRDNRNIAIPVYMKSGAPGRRHCTEKWKRLVIYRWQRQHGATRENKAVCGLGISLDEFQRMRTESNIPTQTLEYPLIDLQMTRQDCIELIQDEGLPVPPKSSCWFCPFHTSNQWKELKDNQPDLFQKAINLENRINEKRSVLDKDSVTLHSSGEPLTEAVENNIPSLSDDEPTCESGYCMT